MYTLTCEVSVVTGVPNITWMYNNTKVIEESGITLTLEENGLDSRLILQFSPLDYDHAGVYTCSANLTVEEFDFAGFSEASQIINVQGKFDEINYIIIMTIDHLSVNAYIHTYILHTYIHTYVHKYIHT